MSLFALGGVASAHTISSVAVDCAHVTPHFHNFPDSGVNVHIVVLVSGEAAISQDVWVTSATSEVTVDISTVTQELHGATADVDVDVTWTLWGAQHVHATSTVTCGSPTTTEASTTTTMPETTTSSQSMGATSSLPTSSTTRPVGSLGSTTPVAGAGPPISSFVPATAVLPRTGLDSNLPPLIGLSSLLGGSLLLLRRSRVWPF